MTRMLRHFSTDKKGVGAVEFALIAPLLLFMLIGTAQMGKLYLAHAGLRHMVAEGARLASISPRPTDETIKASLRAGGFGVAPRSIGEPQITYGNTNPADPDEGVNFADIRVSATLQLDFFIYRPEKLITLTEHRRVFIYPEPE